jgi:hypothetical protein
MKRVLSAIRRESEGFAEHPFFAFLRDPAVSARQKLAFVPALSHFVMTFADLYRLVLRSEPAADEYQRIVNSHTYEDGEHWKWFLSDLEKMDLSPHLPLTGALRFLWSDSTANVRMLSYRMCRLGLGADSIHKLVLVHCIEATGGIALQKLAPVGDALAAQTGAKLVYFGSHHVDTEAAHTLEEGRVRRMIEEVELAPEIAAELLSIVETSFRAFSAALDDLTTLAGRDARLSPRGTARDTVASTPTEAA